jgi:hypothetical protein
MLGMNFRSLESSLKDTVKSLLALEQRLREWEARLHGHGSSLHFHVPGGYASILAIGLDYMECGLSLVLEERVRNTACQAFMSQSLSTYSAKVKSIALVWLRADFIQFWLFVPHAHFLT